MIDPCNQQIFKLSRSVLKIIVMTRQEAEGTRQEAEGTRQKAEGTRGSPQIRSPNREFVGAPQKAEGKSFLGNFTFRYILLFEKPLRVYGFFAPFYLYHSQCLYRSDRLFVWHLVILLPLFKCPFFLKSGE